MALFKFSLLLMLMMLAFHSSCYSAAGTGQDGALDTSTVVSNNDNDNDNDDDDNSNNNNNNSSSSSSNNSSSSSSNYENDAVTRSEMADEDDDDEEDEHPYTTAGRYIYKYGMTVMFFVGSVGNTLALIVWFRGRLRQNSSSLYFMTLGFIDQYNIFAAVLGSHVIRSYWDFDYIRHHRVLCKLAYYTIVTCAQSAFYLIAFMSLERALVVVNPLKFMNTFTRRRTKITIALIIGFWMLKNSHMFWSNGAVYTYNNGTKTLKSECGLVSRPEGLLQFNLDVRPWIDYAITFTAAAMIFLCNAVIIYGVKRSEKAQNKLTGDTGGSEAAKSRARAMVPLLVSTSLTFLVLALPLQIVTLIWPQNPNDATTAEQAAANMMWSIGLLTNYANNGVNFYIYCLSGSAFRKEFRYVFHLDRRGQKYRKDGSSLPGTAVSSVGSTTGPPNISATVDKNKM